MPTLPNAVAQVAVLPVRVTEEHPVIGLDPLEKDTVPDGLPAPGELTETVAVKVTPWPATLGFTEEAIAVVVAAWLTTWVTGAEVEVRKFVSPE